MKMTYEKTRAYERKTKKNGDIQIFSVNKC